MILYAHADAPRLAPFAALAAVWGPVVEYRTQRPGELWREHMAREIGRARTVLVLWSAAAAGSAELQTELRIAYANRRARLVPVLLDATPMPAELGARHAIDATVADCAVSSIAPDLQGRSRMPERQRSERTP